MKILHIMNREKHTVHAVGLYDKYFFNGEHEILFLNQKGQDSLIFPQFNIPQREVFLTNDLVSDIKLLKKSLMSEQYDWIVLHSLLMPLSVKCCFYIHKKILAKTIWIEWGADLYTWGSSKKNVLGFLRNRVERTLRTNLYGAVCIFPPDCDVYRKSFPKSKAKVFYAPYCGVGDVLKHDQYERVSRLGRQLKENEPIYVQIGHSATPSIRHKTTLQQLSKFADENIRLLLPLSYGNSEYADRVQAYAEQLFPGKTICLRKMIPLDEYTDLINKVDIAIFDTHRQIGLGNLRPMIFHNTKLFLPSDSVMYQYFESCGVVIHKTEDLNDMTFEEFKAEVLPEDSEQFRQYIEQTYCEERQVGFWVEIYDMIKKEINSKVK